MNDLPQESSMMDDPEALRKSMTEIAERSQRLVSDWLARNSTEVSVPEMDPLNIGGAFMDMTAKMMSDPRKVMESSMGLWQNYLELWQTTTLKMMGQDGAGVAEPALDDRRFKHDDWSDNLVFDYIKQSYLLTARWLEAAVHDVDGLDDKTQAKVNFYTKQFTDALSPTNFVMTNPEVLRATVESKGENLVNGLNNLLADLERGDGKLAIRMTDADAFEVGVNVATAPGKVIFRNDLMELLQFTPTTDTVAKTPLLICPPWINKFYILDLRQKNSFIQWAVAQGHTVFVISWVNPDAELAKKSFEDYMLQGPLAAMDAIRDQTGETAVNIIGYCIGGTLTACALAWLAQQTGKHWKNRVKSATFLTTMVDFSNSGDLGVFIDDEQVASLEKKMNERGYLEGSEMAATFNMLRANDLIWSFVVNNYLLGKDPFPFDLLYWNSDSTRMPAAMHSFYLRTMYIGNKLIEPGGVTLAGAPLDLTRIKAPAYIVSTREDHIAPWKAAYQATRHYKGPIRFVLSASGHIAGVINPPDANKYCYWTNSRKYKDCDAWLEKAARHEGSWWPDWDEWVKKKAGGDVVDARDPAKGGLKPLADAPGTYVRAKP